MKRFTRTLRLGDRGQDVREIQERLNSLDFDAGLEDGIFGSATQQAVIQFQRSKGLVADGIVGPTTFNALFDISGTAKILINLSEKRLHLYLGSQLYASYPVAIGKPIDLIPSKPLLGLYKRTMETNRP